MTLNKNKIALNHFQVENLLGSGAYGKVFLVKKRYGTDKDRVYALKIIKKAALTRQKTVDHINTERRVLERVRGLPFIIQMQYAFQDDVNLYLVMDYASGGELFGQLQKLVRQEDDVRFYAAEILLALEHLHQNNIIYRDIKLENILLDSKGHIIIADLGLARFFGERPEDWTSNTFFGSFSFCGTVDYMSPEILESSGHSFSTDLWSFGVLIYEMLTGNSPYTTEQNESNPATNNPGGSANSVHNLLARIHESTVDRATLSDVAYDLITKLLVVDANRRLTIRAAKEHPFFTKIDWHALASRRISPPIHPRTTSPTDVSNFPPEFTKQRGFQPPVPSVQNPRSDSNNNRQPDLPHEAFRDYEYIAPSNAARTIVQKNADSTMKSVVTTRGRKTQVRSSACAISPMADVTLDQFEGHFPTLFAKYRPSNMLFLGQFSKCYIVERRPTQAGGDATTHQLCVKIIRRRMIDRFDLAENEAQIFRQCIGCPFILNFKDSLVFNNHVLLVTEFANGGTVFERQQRNEFTWQQISKIFHSVAKAIEFLHKHNIGHFDIKENNIFIQKSPCGLVEEYRLGDFGFACQLPTATSTLTRAWCSPSNAAPEVLIQGVRIYENDMMASFYLDIADPNKGYGLSADIWSLGTVLYSLLFGQSPLVGPLAGVPFKFSDVIHKIRQGVFRENLDQLSPKLNDLLCGMLEIDPKKRLNISQVIELEQTLTPMEFCRQRVTPATSDLSSVTPTFHTSNMPTSTPITLQPQSAFNHHPPKASTLVIVPTKRSHSGRSTVQYHLTTCPSRPTMVLCDTTSPSPTKKSKRAMPKYN